MFDRERSPNFTPIRETRCGVTTCNPQYGRGRKVADVKHHTKHMIIRALAKCRVAELFAPGEQPISDQLAALAYGYVSPLIWKILSEDGMVQFDAHPTKPSGWRLTDEGNRALNDVLDSEGG
jgi:hypothetical protein